MKDVKKLESAVDGMHTLIDTLKTVKHIPWERSLNIGEKPEERSIKNSITTPLPHQKNESH